MDKANIFSVLLSILLFIQTFLFIGAIYPYHKQALTLDTFHEGETIGMAIDYLYGKKPYKDTIFVHGAFQDPIRSVLAFKLWGKSIASSRIMSDILSIFVHILFLLFLFALFNKNIFFATIGISSLLILNLTKIASWSLPARDIPLMFWLFGVLYIRNSLSDIKIKRESIENVTALLLFLAISAFAYSIDRGFYISFASLIVLVLLMSVDKSLFNTVFILKCSFGALLGIILLGFAVKFAFYDFFNFTFCIMPKYKELMDGFVCPFYKHSFLVPVFLISLNIFYLLLSFLILDEHYEASFHIKLTSFFKKYFIEIIFCLLSIIYFRSALGRSDNGHAYYVSLPIYLTSIYILINVLFKKNIFGLKSFRDVSIYLSLVLIIISVTLSYHNYNIKELWRFPLNQPDNIIIPQNYTAAIKFLKKNLGEDEFFLTMTSEASWYYFINKPCPTKFPVVWFAMPPFYQEDIVNDLKSKNIKFILYKNKHWANHIDGFSVDERLPIVTRYIHQYYQKCIELNGNEIWIKKTFNKLTNKVRL